MKNIKLPKVSWDRVLVIAAFALGASLILALLTRSRTIILLVQFLDVAIILGLVVLVAIALAKNKK